MRAGRKLQTQTSRVPPRGASPVVAPGDALDSPRPRLTPGVLLGVGLVLLGLGLMATGRSMSPATTGAVGANAGVNRGAGDRGDITAHNSPAIVQNPRSPANLAVANRIDLPRYSCALHVSFDAGATWRETTIPFPEGEESPPRCYAPDPVFDVDGTLYVAFTTLIGFGNSPNAAWITSSGDGGRTLARPRRVLGPNAFQTRLVADRATSGRLYLSWLEAGELATLGFAAPGNPIKVARSDDGGVSWERAVAVSPASRQRVLAPSPAVASDGDLLVAYLDLRDDRLDYSGAHEGRGGDPYPGRWELIVSRSNDQGRTWRETTVDTRLMPAQRIVAFIPPAPSVAIDAESNRVYVTASDASLGDADVWLWTSKDGGATFGPRLRVNDTPQGDGTAQYLPAVAVAPNGRVDVLYYDRRSDRADIMNEVSLQSSHDNGSSFGRRLRLSATPFDSRIGFGSERGLAALGSRLGLISAERTALAVWPDTRAGTEASGKQDLARVVVEAPQEPSALRLLLRIAGPTVAAGGLLLLGLSIARRRAGTSGGRLTNLAGPATAGRGSEAGP